MLRATKLQTMPEDGTPNSRRDFLRVCAVGGAALVGACLGGWTLIDQPTTQAPAARGLPLVPMLAALGLPQGKPVALRLTLARRDAWRLRTRTQDVFVTRVGEGGGAADFRALSPVCPHKGCAVAHDEKLEAFVCPCHDARFDLAGERTNDVAPRDMDPLELSVAAHNGEDWLFVKWQDYLAGTPERTARTA